MTFDYADKISDKPLDVLGPIIDGTIFANSTAWQHVAAEDYFFSNAASAVMFFQNLPDLKDLVWDGSSGSFTLATNVHLVFNWLDEL